MFSLMYEPNCLFLKKGHYRRSIRINKGPVMSCHVMSCQVRFLCRCKRTHTKATAVKVLSSVTD